MASKNIETEIWTALRMSIFTYYDDKLYCLHWDYLNNYFYIRDTASGSSSYIVRTTSLPTSITPDNAVDKLSTYLLFQWMKP